MEYRDMFILIALLPVLVNQDSKFYVEKFSLYLVSKSPAKAESYSLTPCVKKEGRGEEI